MLMCLNYPLAARLAKTHFNTEYKQDLWCYNTFMNPAYKQKQDRV